MEDIIDLFKDIYNEHKKVIIGMVIAALVLVIGVNVFKAVYNPITISWGENSVIATKEKIIVLDATATDKYGKAYDIEWEVSDGQINTNFGNEIKWSLPDNPGVYTVTVKCEDKIKSKNITVLDNELSLQLHETLKYDENNDEDADGIINSKEVENSTAINLIDSDGDGLSDYYELNVSKTSPTISDSDEDGINDGNEILLQLDPLSKNEDTNLKYNFSDEKTGTQIEITGKENIASTTVNEYKLDNISSINKNISPVYQIHSEGEISDAIIKLKYNKETITSAGINESNLGIYRVDMKANEFEKIDSNLDTQNSIISCNVNELGMYFIGDTTTISKSISTELMFVIDNSGSMYSSEEVSGSAENDVDFKRVDLSNKIIDKLEGHYKFGAGKFTFEYTSLSGMTENKSQVKEQLNSIKSVVEKFTGTYIGNAISEGVKAFSNQDIARKYMILLTDGKDSTDVQGYDKDKITKAIQEAKDANVKIFTIGLGQEIEQNTLKNISEQTGGEYYYATNDEILESIFELISAKINYNLVDSNRDNLDDSIVLNDSKFITKRDGFPFNNFASTKNNYGVTYGMTLFAKLYYQGDLPKSLDSMTIRTNANNGTVKADGYNLGNSVIEDSLSNLEFENLYFLSKEPNDFRYMVENNILLINPTYSNEYIEYGFNTYNIDTIVANAPFRKYNQYYLDMDSEAFLNSDYNEKEIINAFYRLDILKYRQDEYNFSSIPDESFNKLVEMLKNNEPALLVLNENYTVCAIKLLADSINPNKMLIEVYDSNYSNKNKFIEVTRTNLVNEKNKYQYKFSYNGNEVYVKISIPSIETKL